MAQRNKFYEFDYATGKISLKRDACPRCGKLMARHKDRKSCGYCGYSVFAAKEKN